MIGILGIAFLASIVLVTILLPNIYFRVMLFTDQSVQQRRSAAEFPGLIIPIIHIRDYEERLREEAEEQQ